MATYRIKTPDGQTYDVTAPDNASQADILAYAQAHHAAASPQVGVGEDVAKSIAPGLGEGVAAPLGSIGEAITNLAAPGVNLALKETGQPSITQRLLQLAHGVTGDYKPQTTAGEYAKTIASFAPAAVMGPEGLVPKIASAVVPAVASETAGQITKGTPYEQIARLLGGLAGGGLSGVRARMPQTGSLLGDVSPETQALYQKMKALGINIRPAQAAQPGFVKTADSELQRLPFTGYGKGDTPTNAQQVSQTTQALLKTTGSNASVANDAAMAAIKKNLGDTYNGIFNRNFIALTPDFHDTLNQIGRDAQDNLLGEDGMKVASVVRKIQDKAQANGGVLTGRQYQNMRQQGGPIYQIAKSTDPGIATWGKNLRSALDNEFANQADPTDAALLKQTNQQYQNYKILQPLASKAAVGQLSPQLLLSQVNQHGGTGDIQTIARGAQAFLKEPANSMTAERGAVLRALHSPAALGTGLLGAGAVVGGTGGGLASIPLALLTSRLLKNAVNSKAAQRQLMGGQPPPPLMTYTPPTPEQMLGQAAVAGGQ